MAGKRRRVRPVRHFIGLVVGSMLLATVAAAAAALIVVPKLTGSTPMTVLTGSMEPSLPPGTVVVVKPTPTEELQIGDVITYQIRSGEPEVVTHRIVAVQSSTDGSRSFITQGDNNDAADTEPVKAVQVRGKVWYDVPLAGYVATSMSREQRDVAVNVLAGGLIAYGVYLCVTAVADRRRPRTSGVS